MRALCSLAQVKDVVIQRIEVIVRLSVGYSGEVGILSKKEWQLLQPQCRGVLVALEQPRQVLLSRLPGRAWQRSI